MEEGKRGASFCKEAIGESVMCLFTGHSQESVQIVNPPPQNGCFSRRRICVSIKSKVGKRGAKIGKRRKVSLLCVGSSVESW